MSDDDNMALVTGLQLERDALKAENARLERRLALARVALKEITYDGPIWRAQEIARRALEQERKE